MKLDDRRKPHVFVNQDACQGCKNCLHACIYGVYRWNKEKNISEAAYPEDCTACRHCEFYCPAKCITIQPAELVFNDPIYDVPELND